MIVPPGFHIDAQVTGEDEKPEGEQGDQPYAYPMGIGGLIMNGCYDSKYQLGDPCYVAKDTTTLCLVSLKIVDSRFFTVSDLESATVQSTESQSAYTFCVAREMLRVYPKN